MSNFIVDANDNSIWEIKGLIDLDTRQVISGAELIPEGARLFGTSWANLSSGQFQVDYMDRDGRVGRVMGKRDRIGAVSRDGKTVRFDRAGVVHTEPIDGGTC